MRRHNRLPRRRRRSGLQAVTYALMLTAASGFVIAGIAVEAGLDLIAVGLIAVGTAAGVLAVRRRGRSTPRLAVATVLVGVLGLAVALAALGIRGDPGRQPLLTVLQQVPHLARGLVAKPSPDSSPRQVLERVEVRTTVRATEPAASPTTASSTAPSTGPTTGPTTTPRSSPTVPGKGAPNQSGRHRTATPATPSATSTTRRTRSNSSAGTTPLRTKAPTVRTTVSSSWRWVLRPARFRQPCWGRPHRRRWVRHRRGAQRRQCQCLRAPPLMGRPGALDRRPPLTATPATATVAHAVRPPTGCLVAIAYRRDRPWP